LHDTPTPPTTSPFPYPTLFRSRALLVDQRESGIEEALDPLLGARAGGVEAARDGALAPGELGVVCGAVNFSHDPIPFSSRVTVPDRKSTRLNSSHVAISYAVFC